MQNLHAGLADQGYTGWFLKIKLDPKNKQLFQKKTWIFKVKCM